MKPKKGTFTGDVKRTKKFLGNLASREGREKLQVFKAERYKCLLKHYQRYILEIQHMHVSSVDMIVLQKVLLLRISFLALNADVINVDF